MKRYNLPLYVAGALGFALFAYVSFASAPLIAHNPYGHDGWTANQAYFLVYMAGLTSSAMTVILAGCCLVAVVNGED